MMSREAAVADKGITVCSAGNSGPLDKKITPGRSVRMITRTIWSFPFSVVGISDRRTGVKLDVAVVCFRWERR